MMVPFLLLSFLAQDDSAKAREFLEEASAKLKGAPALAFERRSTWLLADVAEPYSQNDSKIVLRRPNQMRLDCAGKTLEMFLVLDGTTLWQLDRQSNEVHQFPQKGGIEDYWLRDGALISLYLGATPAKILEGAREIRRRTEKEGEIAVDVFSWKAPLPSEQVKIADFTLWLGPDRLPRRFRRQYERKDRVHTHTEDYGNVDLAPGVNNETFVFTPPKGAKLLDPDKSRREEIPTTEEAKKAQQLLEAVRSAFLPAHALRYEMTTEDDQARTRSSTTLQRPNFMRKSEREDDSESASLTISDGSDLWAIDPSVRQFHKFALELGPSQYLGDSDPLATLFFEPESPLLLSAAKEVVVAKAALEGVACDVVGWTRHDVLGGVEKFRLWIGPDHHPRQMSTEWSSQGRSGTIMIKYGMVDLSPLVPQGSFVFKPGADWRDITNESPGAKHLAVGTLAPDFEIPDRGGAMIRLSELRGKPVVLVFSPFARASDADRAQEFHEDFGSRGAIVLGIASGKKKIHYDPKKHTFRLLRAGNAGIAEIYGADVWSSLYLLGADGKVLAATVSNDELRAAVARILRPAALPAGGAREARASLKRAAEALSQAAAIRYPLTWRLKDSGGFTRFEAKVVLKRPGLARIEGAFRDDGERDEPALILLDGKTEWIWSPKDKRVVSCPQKAIPLSEPYEDPLRLSFFGIPQARWMELAEDLCQTPDRLNGTRCSLVEWRVRYTSDVKVRLWIDEAFAIRRFERTVAGQPVLIAEYGMAELDPKLGAETFQFEPPKDAVRPEWRGDFEKQMIAVGAEAPDFEARDLEGHPVKLSSWRGKPVLFITWSFP
jgi:outer membrane lipoprotein-sorting protein/peroxiredoxin